MSENGWGISSELEKNFQLPIEKFWGEKYLKYVVNVNIYLRKMFGKYYVSYNVLVAENAVLTYWSV